MHERTHGPWMSALSPAVACAIDGETGEIFRTRKTPDHSEILTWIQWLPGPCLVVYEQGLLVLSWPGRRGRPASIVWLRPR
ncbi:hypothetical protein J2S94_004231 [Arthrobacter bambusae]|nr:hypothetical protein [Arthrobacter bambusae]